MKQFFKHRGWSLSMLALIISFTASAQSAEGYYGPAINTGQLSHGVGTGVQAFSILTGGSFDGYTNGRSVDNFTGPNALAGAQEIGGIIAPGFDTLQFNNGATSAFNITNTAGIVVNGALAFNNGITTTVRTNRTAGLAGAIQFLGNAVYTPALAPALNADLTFTDGFVSKLNPTAFVFPVGTVTDLRPITATGTGTFVTAWNKINVVTNYPYTTASLPTGTSALNTNGYWEWSGTAVATATLSIPELSTFATANKLSVMGYNGTAWTNLGGKFTSNVENTTNTAVVTIPATTQAIAIGQTVDYVQVSPSAFLQGAMSGAVMGQGLKTANVLPLAQPYNNTKTNYAGTEVLTALPTNIVDWVLVDIRDSTTATTIIATKAALLMTDGTITDVDGLSPVLFLNVTPGNYYVGLRHRNHLAIRSAVRLALSNTTTAADFRSSMASVYTNTGIANAAMKDLGGGKFAMWGGDVNGDGVVRYGNSNNDRFAMLTGCLSGNTGGIIVNLSGCDLNMDGTTKYGGGGNDRFFLLSTILGGLPGGIIYSHL